MLNKRKKAIITFGTIIPIAGASIGLLVYYNTHKNEEINHNNPYQSVSQNNQQESSDIYDNMDIFPKIETSDFYKYIRYENGRHIINDDFIAAVINYVVANMKVAGGSIHYKYTQTSPANLNITFY